MLDSDSQESMQPRTLVVHRLRVFAIIMFLILSLKKKLLNVINFEPPFVT